MSINPSNTNASESMDIPQATSSNTSTNNGNAVNQTQHGELVMEVNYGHQNPNAALHFVNNPFTMATPHIPFFPQQAITSTTASTVVPTLLHPVSTVAAVAAIPTIATIPTAPIAKSIATPKAEAKVEASEMSEPIKTPSSNKSKGTPQQLKSSIISPKIPRYLIKSSNGRVTYITMIHEAIVELADRSGSSVPAIQKFMKGKHEHLQNLKPKVFNSNVNTAIKAGLKEERFVKIRNSYKMNSAWVRKQKDLYKAREAKKRAAEKKRKMEAAKIKAEKEKKMKEQKEKAQQKAKEKAKIISKSIEQKAAEEKKKLDLIEAERKRAAAQAKAAAIAERIKKRRFPMDDLELIAEDKELGVKRSADICKLPFLPFTFSTIIPYDERPATRKTTSCTVINASTATMSQSSRSIVSDVLQVYHFFRGDVGFGKIYPKTIPEFSFDHLLFAVNEVMNGNMRKSQLVPPLLGQLFHASLDILTESEDDDWAIDCNDGEESKKRKCLKHDLVKLNDILDETSWGQILMCYIDLMERFYSGDATLDPNALPGYPITLAAEGDEDHMDTQSDFKDQTDDGNKDRDFVDGYYSYTGPTNGPLNRGFLKLLRHDPWCLTAEELIAILRTLTDDILAMKAKMNETFVKRDEESCELLKNKKATESQFRKVRLAFEGPKYPSKSKAKKTTEDGDEGKKSEKKENIDESVKSNDGGQEQKKFKPTATKKEFEEAEKARIKAIEQYDKNINNFIGRSVPFGHDRNHNAYFYFHTDPKKIHVEMNRNSHGDIQQIKSWHCIDHKPIFDNFVSSLDKRGIRENLLLEKLTGNGVNFRKVFPDGGKKKDIFAVRQREEEEFERRLNNAMIASADQGRRSGRLANGAKDEVSKIRKEMEEARLEFEKQIEIHNNGPNYRCLTGITAVEEFESSEDVHTDFSKLCEEGCKTSGTVLMVASTILDLEYVCETLDPWDRKDISREAWISNIENTSKSYEHGSVILGPKSKNAEDETPSPSKRQRRSLDSMTSPRDSLSSVTLSQVMNVLKASLLELEQRIYSFTGLERAVREADEADDNGSVDSTEMKEIDEEQRALERDKKIQLAWKKKINSIKDIPTKRASAIRDVLIAAIGIARKGNLDDVLADLRSALNLHRPGAAGKARQTALSALEKHGGYNQDGGDDDLLSDDDDLRDLDDENNDNKPLEEDVSFLCTEAMMILGCLDGDDNADRVDWKESVNECKTLSRFGALVAALSARAMPKLRKLADDKNNLKKAIKYWETGNKTRKSKSQKKTKEKYNSATEIWANTNQTDEFVLGKVEGFPWWPARICIAKDPDIRASLQALDRVLISFIGEHHLHIVKRKAEIKAFKPSKKDDENIGDYSEEIVKNLRESTAMAKRILRGRKDGDEKSFVEEKKSSN